MAKMRVYLDNCTYNRPFDDKDQLSIQADRFDYTEWQQDLWIGKTIEEIHRDAAAFYAARH
jgi:hypothetical protein